MSDKCSSPQENSQFPDADKNTNLHYKAASGNLEDVIDEITAGSKIDPVNFMGWTPLMMAARNGHFEVVEYLIGQRADSTSENYFGCNILLMAVASGELRVIHVLLQHLLCGGVSRRILQKFFSPVSLAVLFGYRNVVEYLIQNSLCVNGVGAMTDSTPLMFANIMGNTELGAFLISKGAKGTSNARAVESTTLNQNAMHKRSISQLSPIILVNQPQMNPPSFNGAVPNPLAEMARRCSDLHTPYFTPHVSPLQPGQYIPQVFFPPNFSPSHFYAPVNPVPFVGNSDFLNVRILQSSPYYSPFPPIYVSPFNMA